LKQDNNIYNIFINITKQLLKLFMVYFCKYKIMYGAI